MNLPENPDLKGLFTSQGIIGNQEYFTNEFLAKLTHSYFDIITGNNFILAFDMREISQIILNTINSIAISRNITIKTCGMTSLDHLLFSISNGKFSGGIMISPNSSNKDICGIQFFDQDALPLDYNNFFNTYSSQQKTDLNLIDTTNLTVYSSLKDFFFNTIKSVDPLTWRNFKIVIDGGNGIGAKFLLNSLVKMPQIEAISLYSEPNILFPHHLPELYDRSCTIDLSKSILSNEADFGVALNHDGNQLLFLDKNGQVIEPCFIGALLTKIIIDKNPSAKIGYTPEYKWAILSSIKNNDGVALKNNFTEILKFNRELNLDFTTTKDGTYIFKESNYSTNSLLTICLILEYLSIHKQTLNEALFTSQENISCKHLYYPLKTGTKLLDLKISLSEIFESAQMKEELGISFEEPNYHSFADFDENQLTLNIFIESRNELLNNDIATKLWNKLQNSAQIPPSINQVFDKDNYPISLLSPREKFEKLLNNFWFTWNPHYIMPIIDLYGDGWRKNLPPEALIANYGKEGLAQLLLNKNWELGQNLRIFDNYITDQNNFLNIYSKEIKFKIFITNPIVYFCMEFGFVDWLQIYSGGLGILAADYIKQASDSGIPVVGIGIFYHQGYLHQDFGPDGAQLEHYIHQDPMDYNMELAKDKDGNVIVIDLPMGDTVVKVRAWKQMVGKSIMYLLDTNFEDNKEWEDRLITGYLYGGDIENRIKQEILLGIGGTRLLQKLEIQPSIYHMNEGHSGFLIFERVREIMKSQQIDFDSALLIAKENLVFTNHTLKQAGNDIFDFMLFDKYLKFYATELNVDINKIFNMGDDKTYSQGGFSMTVFCLRNATISNAVSKIHGKAAANLWKDYNLIPVTNGVHLPTWVSPEIHMLLDQYVGENWHLTMKGLDFDSVQKIPSNKLWNAHIIRKKKLINSLNNELGLNLKEDVLTIAWSRRLAAYKRPDLIITDIERLKRIVSNTDRPVQFLIAGKSHPKDTIGKQLLQKLNQSFGDDFFKNRIEVIPGYNWQLARRMVSGADIWLNTPYRFEEACGTSGMKAAANGVLQFTTLDGWTDEVDWYKIGWVISENNSADCMYDILENQIIPLYYSKQSQGINEDWATMMRNSIELILKDFSSERMLKDYLDTIYTKLLK